LFSGGPDNTAVTPDTNTADVSDSLPDTTGTSTPPVTSMVKEFTVSGTNFKFTPTTLAVKKGDTVKITFKNTGGVHNFKIDEFNVGTKQIQGGTEETVQFVADKAGTFEYYCSVGTHRQMGMKGTLTVTE
jgi:nitrosocyanin